jgi:hypothetical protein
MVTTNKGRYIFEIIAILLFIGLAIYTTILFGMMKRYEDNLKEERLTSELLLSERLSRDKEIAKLNGNLKTLEGRSEEIEIALNSTIGKLEGKELELRTAEKLKASSSRLKKLNSELEELKKDLEQQLAYYKAELTGSRNSISEMEHTIATLERGNKSLNEEVAKLKLTSFNNSLIESSRSNSKLTYKAKRTRSLRLTVDVPAQIQQIKFMIVDPTGKDVHPNESNLEVNVLKKDVAKPQAFYESNDFNKPLYQTVQMTYTPKARLIPGVYLVQILNDSNPFGVVRVKLE